MAIFWHGEVQRQGQFEGLARRPVDHCATAGAHELVPAEVLLEWRSLLAKSAVDKQTGKRREEAAQISRVIIVACRVAYHVMGSVRQGLLRVGWADRSSFDDVTSGKRRDMRKTLISKRTAKSVERSRVAQSTSAGFWAALPPYIQHLAQRV